LSLRPSRFFASLLLFDLALRQGLRSVPARNMKRILGSRRKQGLISSLRLDLHNDVVDLIDFVFEILLH